MNKISSRAACQARLPSLWEVFGLLEPSYGSMCFMLGLDAQRRKLRARLSFLWQHLEPRFRLHIAGSLRSPLPAASLCPRLPGMHETLSSNVTQLCGQGRQAAITAGALHRQGFSGNNPCVSRFFCWVPFHGSKMCSAKSQDVLWRGCVMAVSTEVASAVEFCNGSRSRTWYSNEEKPDYVISQIMASHLHHQSFRCC